MFWQTCTLSVQRGRGLVAGDSKDDLLQQVDVVLVMLTVWMWEAVVDSGGKQGDPGIRVNSWICKDSCNVQLMWHRQWREGARSHRRLTLVAHFPPLEVEDCVVVGLDGHVELDGQNSLAVHFARTKQIHSKHCGNRQTHTLTLICWYI